MRKTRFVARLSGIIIVLILATVVIVPRASSVPQCRVVRIFNEAMPESVKIRIDPQNIEIDRDTCLIWVNLGQGNMRINFPNGKECDAATEAPSGFNLDGACYVTQWIPRGGTASLTFEGNGAYAYEVEWEAVGEKAPGEVTVR